jgi:lysylphosphatidylglycerol synthetase-like protein (DUF2156 family)
MHSYAPALSTSCRTVDDRMRLVKQFGSHSLAFATLQTDPYGNPLLEYFDTPEGFVAYSTGGARTVVLGNPICAVEDTAKVLKAFLRAHPKSVFVQVGAIVARQLEQLGLWVNRFGTETILDLKYFSLTGRKFEDIRNSLNRATRSRVTIRTGTDAKPSLREIEHVSSDWMHSRVVKSRELQFMVRPAIHGVEQFVRKLYAFESNKLVGFAYYDPMFENGDIIGYHAMTNRYSRCAPSGTAYLLDVTMAKMLQTEGLRLLALGFAPFADLKEKEPFKYSWLAKRSFSFSRRYLKSFYNFRGQELRKRKYRGRRVPLFFASRGSFVEPIIDLLAVCAVSNFSITSQILQMFRVNGT